MPIEIQLPRLGWSMEEGKFLGWLKRDGDIIKVGDPLFTLESDKAAQEVESIDSGILFIPVNGPQPNETLKVSQVLGYLLAEGEMAPEVSPVDSRRPADFLCGQNAEEVSHKEGCHFAESGPSDRRSRANRVIQSQSAGLPKSAGRSFPASPRARRAARQKKVDLSTLQPTGQGGRIRERDVLAAATSTPPTTGFKKVPLTPMRRTIAARLVQSRLTTVPVTITGRCDATALLAFRQQLKAAGEKNHLVIVPTINDILVKLTAAALCQHPMLVATWADDHLLLPESIHLGIAMDTEAGPLAPVIRDVDTSTLTQIAKQSQKLVADAHAGKLATADLQGACFTLSNLGSLGVEAFTPVINPSESAILGIGAIVLEAVPLDDGTFVARDRLTLSLTFDHRVNDGAAAARFLQTLRQLIEQPLLGLV